MSSDFKSILGADGNALSFVNEKEIIRNNNLLGQNFQGINQTPLGLGVNDFRGNVTLSNINTFGKNLRYYFASKFYQLLAWSYVEYGLVRTIVDVPVEDGFRGGVTIKTDEFDEDELKKLSRLIKKRRDQAVAMRALKWARLFGGGAVIAKIDDQDPEEPLDLDSIGPETKVEFWAVNMWELIPNTIALDTVLHQNMEDPEFDYFMYYGNKIHKSRVHKCMGLDVPSILKWQLLGWGASVLEPFIRPFNQYLKTGDLTFEVLDEFKLDIFFIDGFKEAMASDEATQLMMKRVQYANGRKNFQHATVLSEKDKFEQRQLQFTGLAEIMTTNNIQIASVLRMPLTKVFGISAAGFSTGQEDLENYNMMVEGTVREPAEDLIRWMTDIRSQQLFETRPEDMEVEFKSLRVLGGVEEQNVKNGKATILDSARNRGDITQKEWREAANTSKIIDITLDTSDEMMAELEDEQEAKAFAEKPIGGEKGEGAGKSGGKGNVPTPPKPKAKGKVVSNLYNRILNAFSKPVIVTVGIVSGNKILTGKRRDNGLWVSPGGHMDPNETPEMAAIREAKEESGIEIQKEQLEKISSRTITSHRTGKDFDLHAYVARIPEEVEPTTDQDPDREIVEWKWVPIDVDMPELKPEARHAKDDEILGHLFSNGYTVNGPLWEKAKKIVEKEYGEIRWPIVMEIYEKMGGEK